MISHSAPRLTHRGDDGFGGLPERRGLQRLERQREVVAFVHRRGGQHVVAVREGFVDVEVDADDQLGSPCSASSSSSPLGTDSTGFPAPTNSART